MGERTGEYINSSWRFRRISSGESRTKLAAYGLDDSSWLEVTLPHTWNADDCTGRADSSPEYAEGYYRGAGCYRRRVFLPNEQYRGREIFVEFSGANTVTELFVNGKKAGRHEGGYSAFRFDITKLAKVGTENQFVVFVSNAASEYIAPICDCGDFTKMGGIYRPVKLISVNRVHLCDISPFVDVYGDSARVRTSVCLENCEASDVTAKISLEVSGGNEVICSEVEYFIRRGEETEISLETLLKQPHLWDGVRDPFLYTLKASLIVNGEVVDSMSKQFGVRTFALDREMGFILNGKPLKLHGVNYHQDGPRTGWAMSQKQRERDYAMMRDMGCNAVRLAHYQHCEEEYALCDRLGLCVWTEIGIIGKLCPGEPAEPVVSPEFRKSALSQFGELISQTCSHPSVFFYGMSNEIYHMSDSIFDLYSEMSRMASLSGRAAVYADAQFWGKFRELPADAVGYNRYFGWYKEAGDVERFGEWLDAAHEEQQRPLCVSEYGGGGAITQHKDNIDWLTDIDPNGERHYENYQSYMHERIWAQLSTRGYLWGAFVWCMFDFPSAGRKEGDTAGINDKGLCTRERIPKDAFWFYRSVWSGEKTCRITEKRFRSRPALVPLVKAYVNAQRVELFVNGESAGAGRNIDERLPTVFVWENIQLEPGSDNTVTVRAEFPDGTVLEDTAIWKAE